MSVPVASARSCKGACPRPAGSIERRFVRWKLENAQKQVPKTGEPNNLYDREEREDEIIKGSAIRYGNKRPNLGLLICMGLCVLFWVGLGYAALVLFG